MISSDGKCNETEGLFIWDNPKHALWLKSMYVPASMCFEGDLSITEIRQRFIDKLATGEIHGNFSCEYCRTNYHEFTTNCKNCGGTVK